jgi:redox-sensing transcriptional repressor
MPYYLQSLRGGAGFRCGDHSAPTVASTRLNAGTGAQGLCFLSNIAGKPKTGFQTRELIAATKAVWVTITPTKRFSSARAVWDAPCSPTAIRSLRLSIVAAFDVDPNLSGGEISGKQVLPMSKLPSICQSMNIHIGIITVPASQAQAVCDALVGSGVLAIWNFAPMHLNTPEGILVQNENMAASLAVLSKHLSERLESGLKK